MAAVTGDNLHFGSRSDDPNGVRDCGDCNGTAVVGGKLCRSCNDRQRVRDAWWESSGGPERLRRQLGL